MKGTHESQLRLPVKVIPLAASMEYIVVYASVSFRRAIGCLAQASIIIPRTRVYILIAVVPKHFVVSRPKGLSPGWQLHQSRNPQQLNPDVHPLDAKLLPLQGVCDFDCVSDRISLWIVYTDSSFVGGNSQGHEEIEPEKRYRKIASNEAKRT